MSNGDKLLLARAQTKANGLRNEEENPTPDTCPAHRKLAGGIAEALELLILFYERRTAGGNYIAVGRWRINGLGAIVAVVMVLAVAGMIYLHVMLSGQGQELTAQIHELRQAITTNGGHGL